MRGFPETRSGSIALFFLAGVFVAVTQFGPVAKNGGSLLLALLFWAAVAQGGVAVVAACTLIRAKWVASVRRELLSLCPLLLFVSILFLFLVPFVDSYPWMGRKGIWFDKRFFVGRNFVLLLLTYLAARRFAVAIEKEEEGRNGFAILYLFVFVATQSLMAFDWVMSLEYPWYSTLLGGYFFIESLFGGFALSGILYVLSHGMRRPPEEHGGRSDMKDMAILLFGFSLLWAGLFYAQFLVIWYGNLPEEVGFILKRVSSSPLRELSASILACFFILPFLVLLNGKAKTNPYVVFAISLVVLGGILIERFVFLAPVVPVNFGALGIHFLCFTALLAFLVRRRGPGERALEA